MEDVHSTVNTHYRFYDGYREPCSMMAPIEGFANEPLVTLEKATEPLSFILDIQNKVRHCKTCAACHQNDILSIDELAAIKLYTMEWQSHTDSFYYILNTTLRTEDRQALKPWFSYLKLILTALARLPTSKVTAYRGVVLSNSKMYQPGNVIVWWGFSSCSTKRDIPANEFIQETHGEKTMFIIHCNTGTHISKYSLYGREKEILLLPATTLKVMKSYSEKNGLYNVIHLQEIKSPYQLLEPIKIDTEIPSGEISELLKSVRTYFNRTKPDIRAKLNQEIALFRDGSHACIRRKCFNDDELETVVEEVIRKKRCRALFLRGEEITSQGATIIGRSLQNNLTLEELYLTDIQIGDIGAETIGRALLSSDSSSLRQLSLNNNGITNDGAEILANMLKENKSLTHVWITKNLIDDRGIISFARNVINNNNLQLLSLKWNEFKKSETVDAIIQMLENHRTLIQFEINGQDLSSSDLKRLKQFARSKRSLVLSIY